MNNIEIFSYHKENNMIYTEHNLKLFDDDNIIIDDTNRQDFYKISKISIITTRSTFIFTNLKYLINLVELHLSCYYPFAHFFSEIATLKNLKKLTFSGIDYYITKENIEKYIKCELPALEFVKKTDIVKKEFDNLMKIKKFNDLDKIDQLYDFTQNNKLEGLSKLQNLDYLCIDSISITFPTEILKILEYVYL